MIYHVNDHPKVKKGRGRKLNNAVRSWKTFALKKNTPKDSLRQNPYSEETRRAISSPPVTLKLNDADGGEGRT